MKSNCVEREKCEELEMLVKEWLTSKEKDSMELDKYREKNDKEWFDREMMCYVLREDVLKLIDWHKLDLYFIGDICLSSAVNVQNALKRLIDSMQNQLCSNPGRWERHIKSCQVIRLVLWRCKDRYKSHDSSSQQVYAQIHDYTMKMIEMCGDEDTIASALIALGQFPFNKYQSSLLKLIDSVGNKLDTDHWGWQRNLCVIIFNVLRNTKELNQQTCDRLFDYLKKLIDCCEDDETIVFAWSALSQFPVKQISSKVYQPLIQNYLLSSQLNWRMHRNLLKVLIQYEGYDCFDIFKENAMKMWFEYLRNFLHQCDHVELVSLAIELVEVLCLREYFDVESEDVLKSELMGRLKSSECPLTCTLPDEFDFDRYQVEWCARWCVHNVMDRHKRKEMGGKLPWIKLSNDRFEARNGQTDYRFIPVRSQYSVTSGVYFYEVTIATCGEMMFGWSTIDSEFDKFYPDKSQKLICQADGDYILVHLLNCHAGDVIGCLIDTDKRRFVFYCNGKEVMGDDENLAEVNDQKHVISSSSYYATSIIYGKKHCYFNFGQTSFKFPPNIQFMDFYKASGKDERKYRLAETCKIAVNYKSNYWLKHFPVDNQVDLFYRDKRQNECEELVKRVERDIEEGREVEEMKMELGCDRYIQAMIEEMGKTIPKEKIDLMAQWVGRMIEGTIEDTKNMRKENGKLYSRLLALFYPYLHLRINSTLDYTKHRNICIVLVNFIRFSEHYDYAFIKYIRKEVFTYLTRTLTETSDQWTQLFGLIALDNLKLSEEEQKIIQEDTRVMTLLDNYTDTSKYSNVLEMITLENCGTLSSQLHFISNHLLNKYSISRNSFATKPNTSLIEKHKGKKTSRIKHFQFVTSEKRTKVRPLPSSLNIEYQSQYLKVSRDLLTVRTDWRWQTVRYECSGKNRIDCFEVLLLTNGPMRIGWSTKRTELWKGAKLGADEFSISFNGHSRVMYHQNSPSPTHCIPQWKAGDVVACLMHISTGRFYFLLNGHPLPLPDKLYFSPHLPYYPSLSLSAHQQVYCNFGQCNFKYPQPNIEHLQLALSIQKSLQLSGQLNSPIDLSNSSFINTILAIKATNTLGNVTLSHQSQSTPIIPKPNFAKSAAFITSHTFPNQISTKALKPDSKTCFETTPEPQPVASTSTNAHENDAQQQIVWLNEENNRLKVRVVELENQVETMKAQKCDSLTIVHAECCDHLKFCVKCGSAMGSCVGAKCNRK